MRVGLRRSRASYGAGDEVAKLFVLAVGDRFGGDIRVVEVIDEALAAIAIELQSLVEVFLLEHHAIVNAGDVASRRPIRRRGRHRDTLLRGG